MTVAGASGPDKQAMIRVDHAGEFGATRIYAGQMAVLGDRHAISDEVRHMAQQEDRHLAEFERLMTERRVRPTALMPLWHRAGYALGVVSALIGPRAAMAVTAAVETEIDRHYQAQLDALGADAGASDDPELAQMIAEFQAEEQEHRQRAIDHGAEQAPAYPLLSALVRAGCRTAIRLSERL